MIEALIFIALSITTFIPIFMMFITSFTPEWKKVEEEYSLGKRKWRAAARIYAMIGFLVIILWLAHATREGCKECPEYEQITTPIFKKK